MSRKKVKRLVVNELDSFDRPMRGEVPAGSRAAKIMDWILFGKKSDSEAVNHLFRTPGCKCPICV
jgi:hypothetical protein